MLRNADPYGIVEIQSEWVLGQEALGSKRKFWYRSELEDSTSWLFKYPQKGSGQHWAEKVAAEVADVLEILHARVELAEFRGTRGSTTESFARDGRELYHGNQVLAGYVHGYDPDREFHQSDHTFDNILYGLELAFETPEGRRGARGAATMKTGQSCKSVPRAGGRVSSHRLSIMHRPLAESWWTRVRESAAADCSISAALVRTRRTHAEPFSGPRTIGTACRHWSWSAALPRRSRSSFGHLSSAWKR